MRVGLYLIRLDLDLGGKVEVPNVSSSPTATQVIPRTNGPCANVSIFPLAGTGNAVYQIQDHTYTIFPPAINLTVSVSGTPGLPSEPTQVTITGTPAAGEYVTIVSDRQFVYSETGATAEAILQTLLTDAQVNYPLASLSGNTLTIPSVFAFVVRQGGQAVLGKVVKRQCQFVQISIWAPDHNSRSVISAAIDLALKENIIITIPVDNSQAKIVYSRTNVMDTKQDVTLYRRDLIFEVDYATVEEFPGYVITSMDITLAAGEYFQPTPPANHDFII